MGHVGSSLQQYGEEALTPTSWRFLYKEQDVLQLNIGGER